MFSSNKKQYVVITKQDKQLKINYRSCLDNKILKESNSTFLISNQSMPSDAQVKLDTLQKDINQTYLGSLFEGKNQQIVSNQEIDVVSYGSVKLNELQSIVIPKNELNSTEKYFTKSGIDYLLSPFSIIMEYTQKFGVKNSLNALVLNDIVYTIILDEYKQIVQSDTMELTPFDKIKDDQFSDDEIVDQKLYEEVRFLEIQQFLNDTIQNYYSSKEDVDFLEEIKLLYTLQSFTQEQLDSLHETLMVNVAIEKIDIQSYLSEILSFTNPADYSFITPRPKKKDGSFILWGILVVLTFLIISAVVYLSMDKEQKEEKTAPKETKPKEIKKEEKKPITKLPNHTTINYNTKQQLAILFDLVSYDGLLKDIEIDELKSTYVINFALPSSSLEDMQTKLKNIYKESKILLKHENQTVLNAIIENNDLTINKKDVLLQEYPTLNHLSIAKATSFVKAVVLEDSIIKFGSKEKGKYQAYNFNIISTIQSPKEFYRLIDKLSKQKNSISITYPIKFSKLNDSIEVNYRVKLYQNNPTLAELKN